MKKVKVIAVILLATVFISCVLVFVFREKLIAQFTPLVEQTGVVHIKVKNDTSFINTLFIVKNNSFINIKIDTIKYKVALFDKTYLQNKQSLGLVLPPYGSDSLDFSLTIPHAQIIKDIKAEREVLDSAGYSVNITLQYSTRFWKSEMPVNRSGKLKIPQPPELKIEEIKWTKVRFKLLLADVKIKITNHSPVALSINDVNYAMEVLNQGDLKGKYKRPIEIKPNGITIITVPIAIKTKHAGKTIIQVIRNNDTYNYTLKLNAILKSTGPEKKYFYLDLTKTGKIELRK